MVTTFFVIIHFSGCSQDVEIITPAKPRILLHHSRIGKAPIIYNGRINYLANCQSYRDTNGVVTHTTYYQGDGIFYDNPLTRSWEVGTLIWGSITVQPDSTFNKVKYRLPFSKDNAEPAHPLQFGTYTNFTITGGSGYAKSKLSLYLPEEIYLVPDSDTCSCTPILKVSELPKRIYWNQDINNVNSVEIIIEYNGFRSNNKNPSFSPASFFNTPFRVPDIGQLDLKANMFNGIPIGAIITVHLSRINETNITDANGKVIVLTAISETSQDYVYEE